MMEEKERRIWKGKPGGHEEKNMEGQKKTTEVKGGKERKDKRGRRTA